MTRPLESNATGAYVDEVGWLDDVLLECCGRGHDLERRARLVQILIARFRCVVFFRFAVCVRIEGWLVGQREDLTAVRDPSPAPCRPPLGCPATPTRSSRSTTMLQILIDRQLQCRTAGWRSLDSAERPAPGVSLDEHRARTALDQRVVRRLRYRSVPCCRYRRTPAHEPRGPCWDRNGGSLS